jgi:choice-of-anchor B domain-containing protein
MKNKIILLSIILLQSFSLYAQKNMTLLGSYYFGAGIQCSGCWHYNHISGREYALVGTSPGIAILDITQPDTPVYLFTLPGEWNLWHEVKTDGDYAYAVSEGSDSLHLRDGLQVIDLRYLPDSAPNYFWQGDSVIAGQQFAAHAVTADNGYVYINGSRIGGWGGVLIIDVADPMHPHFVGKEINQYCHDSYVRDDRLYTSDISVGQFAVYDISDRYNPVLLATQGTPAAFNHNTWLSDNSQYIFTADERTGSPIGSYDISDLQNIQLMDLYYTVNMYPAESHNVRVLNDYIINASYGSQVTIVDASHPDNLVEVGNHPTGTSLCWDADPFPNSGNIIATDMNSGMFYVFAPTYIRGCRLEGVVTDSASGALINTVHVDIAGISISDSTNLFGSYKTGYSDSGMYDVTFSKTGYFPKTITGVVLTIGNTTILDVILAKDNTGIPDYDFSSLVSLYPNPVHHFTQLSIDKKMLDKFGTFNFTLKDVVGKIIFENDDVHSSHHIIDCSPLSSGIYFYELKNGVQLTAKGKMVVE